MNKNLWPDDRLCTERVRSDASLQYVYRELLEQEKLPDDEQLFSMLDELYLPLAQWVSEAHHEQPLIIGINGAQGSGKSTLGRILQCLLEQVFAKKVVTLSIDDLYLTRSERMQLAKRVHPLLATRGVPGTHDVKLGIDLLARLKQGQFSDLCLPQFDKATDDRKSAAESKVVQSPVDIILFEGWCVGAIPQQDQDLYSPVNQLEAEEDEQGAWRRYVNQQLASSYQELFDYIDRLIMLKVPHMESVYEWRLLQEHKLKENQLRAGQESSHVMSDQQLRHFIMHYERITKHLLTEMPSRADVVLELNDDHLVEHVSLNDKL